MARWVKVMGYLDNFNYQIIGQNRKGRLVFLHGLMGSGANWRKITPAFEQDYEILLFDQRGHGRSFQPRVTGDTGYRPQDYAEDLHKILQELGWDSITLVGHSMGGRNALCFAAQFPQSVKKLVIEDIGPEINLSAIEKNRWLLNLVPTPFPSKKEARQFFLEEYPRRLGDHPQARVISQFFYTNIEEKPDGTADWRFSREGILASVEQGRSSEYWDQLKSLKMPTLVIRGDQSDELSPEVYERMLKANPLVQGCEVKSSGHWVHFDQPQSFIQCLAEFFEKD